MYIYIRQADIKYNNIPSITKIRVLRNSYQREYEKTLKSKNWVEMREEKRYLHYEEIQQVLKELMNEFLENKEAENVPIDLLHAKRLQSFLILLFYTSLPPSRAVEIRTLQQGVSLQFKSTTNTWWLVLDRFKTVKHRGIDSVELDPSSQELLITYLEFFITSYRKLLFEKWKANKGTQEDENYLFVPSSKCATQCYPESSWSAMVCNLFRGKTGMNVTINILRSSFITYFYSSDASENLSLCESIANGMRHSISEAKRTYDRRTSHEKKRKAVDWCGNTTTKWLTGDQMESISLLPTSKKLVLPGPTPSLTFDDSEPFTIPPVVGDIVAVPFNTADGTKDFWLGKCLRIGSSNIILGWLEPTDKNCNKYKMKLGASWEENIKACIYPIDVIYNESYYTLNTPAKDILASL